MPKLDELAPPEAGPRKPVEWDLEEEIGAFAISKSRAVTLQRKVRGKDVFYDFRVYYYDRGDKKWKPTPKGFMIQEQFLGELKNLIDLTKGGNTDGD
ncbi:MAG: PC4/YdbC family ssDNA-binding protein [Candidatus Methanomethyliaceae archaeon]